MPDVAQVGLNAIDPDRLTPEERVAEVGRILAAGVLRLHAGKSSPLSADRGDSWVDFLPGQRRHADTLTSGKA